MAENVVCVETTSQMLSLECTSLEADMDKESSSKGIIELFTKLIFKLQVKFYG